MFEEILIKSVFENDQRGLGDLISGLDNLDKSTKVVAKTFQDELRARIDGALSTAVEFGGSLAQVARAQDMLTKSASRGAAGVAQQANLFRKLVDEIEDVDKALENVAQANELAAAAGLKLEDAGAELGRMLKGEVDVLKRFDDRARRVADAIEKIQDPTERARLAQLELERALKRQTSTLGKARQGFAALDAELAKVGLSKKKLAAAAAGVTVALAGTALVGIKNYAEANKDAGKAIDEGNKALERASALIGKNQLEHLGGADAVEAYGLSVEGLTKDLLDIQKEYFSFESLNRDTARAIAEVSSEVFGMESALKALNAQMDRSLKTGMGRGVSGIVGPALTGATKNLKKFVKEQIAAGKINEKEAKELNKKIEDEFKRHLQKTNAAHAKRRQAAVARRKERQQEHQRELERRRRARLEIEAIERAQRESEASAAVTGAIEERLRQQKKEQAQKDQTFADENAAFFEASKNAEDLRSSLHALGVEGFGAVTNGALDMVEGLALGDIALKDFGHVAADTVGDIMTSQGRAMAEHAIKQGAIFALFGEAYAALATNPLALAGIGLALVGAGVALKRFGGERSKSSTSAGRADTAAASAIERMGRDLFNRSEGGERTMVLMVGDRQMRGYVVDTTNDAARRGELAPLQRT